MITKEKLEQLIKQNSTIWNWEYGEIKLDDTCEICETTTLNDVHIGWILYKKEKDYTIEVDINDLEEDVEFGKFKDEYQDVRNVENLELPFFDNIPNNCYYDKIFFRKSNDEEDDDNTFIQYYFHIDKRTDEIFIKSIKIYYNIILDTNYKILYYDNASKYNYLEACSICHSLFLGGKYD